MTRATIRLTLPDAVWVGDLSRRFPAARIRILAALSDDDSGVGLAEIEAAGVEAARVEAPGPDDTDGEVTDTGVTGIETVLDAMAGYDDVTDLRVLREDDDAALAQFETTLPLLLFAARDSGVPLEMPFDIVDGEAVWTLTAPRERLSELCTQLDAFGIQYAVERVGGAAPDEALLTDRQERLLEAAAERGYYDTPRGCSLTELADEQGYAKSTVSEVLHRAEGAVVGHYLADRASPAAADHAGGTRSPSRSG